MDQSCGESSLAAICTILIKSYSGFAEIKKPPEGGLI